MTTMRQPAVPTAAARPLPAAFLLLATLLVPAMLLIPAGAEAQLQGIAVGETPEPVVLETLDGEDADLATFIGNGPVLFEFWATWCAVCRALDPEMRAAHEAYGDQVDFVIVAAAVAQTRDQVRLHVRRHGLPGTLLWDTRGRFTRAFDAPGTGWVVILDADGRVAYSGTGGDQDLRGALAEVVGDG